MAVRVNIHEIPEKKPKKASALQPTDSIQKQDAKETIVIMCNNDRKYYVL